MPPTSPAAPGGENKKEKKEQLPPPTDTLLRAIERAWEAGVPISEAMPLIRLARNAKGYKAQTWRQVADTLNEAAELAEQSRPASTPPPTGG
jgi:hypothetical protein